MKILKCLGLLIMLVASVGGIVFVEYSSSIPHWIFFIPNIIIGCCLGLLFLYFIHCVMSD